MTNNIEPADDTIEEAMIKLAKDVAKSASETDRSLPDKIDALKTLTAVYAALKKHKTDDPDEDQGNGFNFQAGVTSEEPSHDPTVTPLRSRRRPG